MQLVSQLKYHWFSIFQVRYIRSLAANVLIFSKIQTAPYTAVRLMHKFGFAFSSRTNCMW